MTRRTRGARALAAALQLFLFASAPCAAAARQGPGEGFDLHVMRRVNAHGDEYNSIAATPGAGRLVIGTEGGELVVWDTAAGRVERRLRQGSPVHEVVSLGDGRRFLAVGGFHTGAAHSSVAREWDIETGASRGWPAEGADAFTLLACDPRSGLVAAATGGMASGRPGSRVFAWSSRDGRAVATWGLKDVAVGLAVSGETVYLTTADAAAVMSADEHMGPGPNSVLALDARDPKRAPRRATGEKEGRLWLGLAASPGGRLLAAARVDDEASSEEGYAQRVALLAAGGARETAVLEGDTPVWFADDGLLVFGRATPARLLRLKPDGTVAREEAFEAPKGWHTPGEPEDFKGAVVSEDGRTAWGVFRQNAGLARWDLGKKDGRAALLSSTPSLVYAMDVLGDGRGGGLVATGGDDGFVRVWRLKDFSLLREFRVPFGVPQGVALVEGGRRLVYSYGSGAARGAEARADNGLHVSAGEKGTEERRAGANASAEVASLDLESGAVKVLLRPEGPGARVYAAGEGFVYASGAVVRLASGSTGETLREFSADARVERFAVSNNRRRLAVADEGGALYLFDVAAGRREKSREQAENPTCLAPADDGRAVYAAEFRGRLRRWDAGTGALSDAGELRGQCAALRVSTDGRRLAVGGNHHDVAVYDARTGERVGHYLSEAADFYVTNVWLDGRRLVYTADGGVLYDGNLVPSVRD